MNAIVTAFSDLRMENLMLEGDIEMEEVEGVNKKAGHYN